MNSSKKTMLTRNKGSQKAMAKNVSSENNTVNLLGNGTTIKGDIQSDGDFRIDGKLIGSIVSKGKVVVGTTGNVEGEIKCKNADISGKLKAQLNVEQLTSLKATSEFSGDIKTGKLAIEPGAKFSGTCDMDGNTPPAVNQQINEKRKG